MGNVRTERGALYECLNVGQFKNRQHQRAVSRCVNVRRVPCGIEAGAQSWSNPHRQLADDGCIAARSCPVACQRDKLIYDIPHLEGSKSRWKTPIARVVSSA